MKKLFYILKLLAFTVICCSILSNIVKAATVKYTDIGVLREDGKCNITFVNFGIGGTISGRTVEFKENKGQGNYNVTVKGLVNGNQGFNPGIIVGIDELYKYVKVTQNENPLDYEITYFKDNNQSFDLRVPYITTCEGLIIKQTFTTELLNVANRLYYVNEIPKSINQPFDSSKFGPSYSYPFERIHWKMNEGLQDLMDTCGIYIHYKQWDGNNTPHWQFYLSVDSVNSKNCTTLDFFEVIRRHYTDYQYTVDLLGEDYVGYVLKREGHVEAHMDGVIINKDHVIEMYQKSCNDQYASQITCSIRTENALTFMEFKDKLLKDCLNITLTEDDSQEWSIKSGVAKGILKDQVLEIKKSDKDSRGSLPSNIDGLINYNLPESKKVSEITVARFIVTYTCNSEEGMYMNDQCKCKSKFMFIENYYYLKIFY